MIMIPWVGALAYSGKLETTNVITSRMQCNLVRWLDLAVSQSAVHRIPSEERQLKGGQLSRRILIPDPIHPSLPSTTAPVGHAMRLPAVCRVLASPCLAGSSNPSIHPMGSHGISPWDHRACFAQRRSSFVRGLTCKSAPDPASRCPAPSSPRLPRPAG